MSQDQKSAGCLRGERERGNNSNLKFLMKNSRQKQKERVYSFCAKRNGSKEKAKRNKSNLFLQNIPEESIMIERQANGSLAQLAEQLTLNQWV